MNEWKDLEQFWQARAGTRVHDYQQAISDSLPSDYDPVNKPKHYMLFEDLGIEVRDVIAKLCDKIDRSEFLFNGMDYSDYCQMMQYLMRFMDKNGIQDLKKAQFYLTKLVEGFSDES